MATTVKKIGIIVCILFIILIFVIKTLYDAGEFKRIVPKTDINCEKIESIPGPEDIVIEYESGIAYISSDDRRAYNKGIQKNGAIYTYNLIKQQLKKLNSNFSFEFHPHGIDIYKTANKTILYVVNHQTNNHSVEKFVIDNNTLIHVRSFHDNAMFSPNDIAVIKEDIFYVTNDHGFRSTLGKTIEEYLQLPASYVLFYDGKQFTIKAKNIRYANGITTNPNKTKLFVASPVGRCIHVYDIDSQYNLTLNTIIPCGTGVDNISFDNHGILWAGCHPKLLTFVRHANNEKVVAPSEVLKITFDGTSYIKETALLDDGNLIQSSTVAVRYNSTLLIGSVFDYHILVCSSK